MTQCQFQTILTGGLSQNPCHLHKLNYVPFLDKSCYLVPFGDTSDLAHARISLFQRKSVGCLPAISTGNIWSLSVLVFLNFSSWHTQPQGSLSNLSAGCWKNQVIATLLRTSVFNGRMNKKNLSSLVKKKGRMWYAVLKEAHRVNAGCKSAHLLQKPPMGHFSAPTGFLLKRRF